MSESSPPPDEQDEPDFPSEQHAVDYWERLMAQLAQWAPAPESTADEPEPLF